MRKKHKDKRKETMTWTISLICYLLNENFYSSVSTLVIVSVVTSHTGFYNTYPTLLLFFAVKLQMDKLGSILDNDSPVAPFDARSHDVIVPSFRGNHAAHFPLVAFPRFIDDDDEVSVL